MAIVLVEQYFEFAYGLADHFYSMRRGEIILDAAKGSVPKSKVLKTLSV
jgi:urea transport system ATP-binding protein